VGDFADDDGLWRVAGAKRIRVLFAGDVGGRRLALLVVPLRLGVVEVHEAMWYEGAAGAAPVDMARGANFGALPDVAVHLAGRGLAGDLLVVAPSGSEVEYSTAVEYGADGRLHRRWTRAETVEGIAVAPVTGTGRLPAQLAARARLGATWVPGEMTSAAWDGVDGGERLVPEDVIVRAEIDTRGIPLDERILRAWVGTVFTETDVDPEAATVTVPWTGTVGTRPAAVVLVQPDGGGVIAYRFVGTARTYRNDLRLLLPAAGAYDRPLAWRVRPEGSDAPAKDLEVTRVAVVVAEGTSRAEVVRDGTVTPLQLAADGTAGFRAATGAVLVVRAFDATGALLGETEVPPLLDDHGSLPGQERATRLVD
jgi:hypothetical protein